MKIFFFFETIFISEKHEQTVDKTLDLLATIFHTHFPCICNFVLLVTTQSLLP